MVSIQIMARFTRLRPVRSIKHIFDKQGSLGIGTTVIEDLVTATDTPTLADIDGVETGATVGSIFLNVQVAATTAAALANVYFAVYKDPGGAIGTLSPQTLGSDDNKKQVIHQEMLMVERRVDGIARTLFKGVIRIPRGYKRFGYNDKLRLALKAPGVTMDYCVQCIYKEFR